MNSFVNFSQQNSKQVEIPQNKLSKEMPKWWVFGMLVLSFVGFLDAVYLTWHHYATFQIPCSFTQGCEEVLKSPYATIVGIPVALLGAVYYLFVFLSLIAFLDRKKPIFLKIAVLLPLLGFLFTLWFLFVQAVLLKAFCFYCLISAGVTTALFFLSLYAILKSCSRELF